MIASIDPATMPLDDLRALRFQLQGEDDVVSYARRIAQARLDLVRARLGELRGENAGGSVAEELNDVLAHSLTSGEARPPRSAADVELDPLTDELDALSAEHGFSRLGELDPDELVVLESQLSEFERRVSENRQQRYRILDELSAELVRRYRDGDTPAEFD